MPGGNGEMICNQVKKKGKITILSATAAKLAIDGITVISYENYGRIST